MFDNIKSFFGSIVSFFMTLVMIVSAWISPANQIIPDLLKNDRGEKIKTVEAWEDQKDTVAALLQEYVYGVRPEYNFDHAEKENEFTDSSVSSNAITQIWKIFYEGGSYKGRFFTLRLTYPSKSGSYPVIMRYENLINFRFPIEKEAVESEKYCIAAIDYMDMFPDESQPDESAMLETKAIMAWACGASLAMDFLETQSIADTSKVLITGHSRTGKAALCAAAFDERFALCVPNSSGAAGASGLRKFNDKGSQGIDIATQEPTWVSENLKKYEKIPAALPLDMHFARALIAPRPILCTESLDGGGSLWAGINSTVKMWQEADAVYSLYGATDNNLINFRAGEHDQLKLDYDLLMSFANHYFYEGELEISALRKGL